MSEIIGIDGTPARKKAVLTLEYELETGKLALSGELANLDLALNVIEQAHRYLKCQYECQQQLLFHQRLQQDQQMMSMIGKMQ